MTKKQVKPFLGKMVLLTWRDPVGVSEWRCETNLPISATVFSITFVQKIIGSDLLVAASQTNEGGLGEIVAIPMSVIQTMNELVLKEDAEV